MASYKEELFIKGKMFINTRMMSMNSGYHHLYLARLAKLGKIPYPIAQKIDDQWFFDMDETIKIIGDKTRRGLNPQSDHDDVDLLEMV